MGGGAKAGSGSGSSQWYLPSVDQNDGVSTVVSVSNIRTRVGLGGVARH